VLLRAPCSDRLASIVPAVTDQVTCVALFSVVAGEVIPVRVSVTEAANCTVWPGVTVADCGLTVTPMGTGV